ncbi:MAG: hypothetical protein RLZZ568_832 [Cyanobacteriota bacterium]|jgi:hypothetical protein
MTNIIAIGFSGYFALLIILFAAKNWLLAAKTDLEASE